MPRKTRREAGAKPCLGELADGDVGLAAEDADGEAALGAEWGEWFQLRGEGAEGGRAGAGVGESCEFESVAKISGAAGAFVCEWTAITCHCLALGVTSK